jgi:hypothetical protein
MTKPKPDLLQGTLDLLILKLTRSRRKQLAEEAENWRRLSTAIEPTLQAS